jgi:hypothetical protein
MTPFGGTVLSKGISRHVFTGTCLRHTWREALAAQFALTLKSTCLG